MYKSKTRISPLGGYFVEGDSFDEEFDVLHETRHHCLPCVRRMLTGHFSDSTLIQNGTYKQSRTARSRCV